MLTLKMKNLVKGRAISITADGKCIIGCNYRLSSLDEQDQLHSLCRLPVPLKRKIIEPCRLLCRLFRHEIRGFAQLGNGDRVAASRQGLYYGAQSDRYLKPATIAAAGPEVTPPMTMTCDSQDRVLWGEYWSNHERRQVRLFCSQDKGVSYEPFWEFPSRQVKHVHNIIEDSYDRCYWVLVGDHGEEPGIGRLSHDLKSLDWLVKGADQKYRVVNAFVFPDKLIYATDTEKDFNGIYAIDKQSGRIDKLCDTPGSSIYAAKFGKWYVVSTSVEHFEKYHTDMATLWASSDALNWQKVFEAKKDMWSIRYFQFGSIVLPRGQWLRDRIILSGQALQGIDGKICSAEIIETD